MKTSIIQIGASCTTICDILECTACMACFCVCRQNAINITEDDFGFKFPMIDLNLCNNCGLCRNVCPEINPVIGNDSKETYAAYSSILENRMSSASGGVASEIANIILDQGGVVYGCAELSTLDIAHKKIDFKENANQLKGSKYVQSDMKNTIGEVLNDLKTGRIVLFTGTPCQVAGLKNSLKHEYENLYTVDLVCHGVPSQKFLKEDVDFKLKSNHKENNLNDCQTSFRRKNEGKIEYGLFIKDKKTGSEILSFNEKEDAFIDAFLYGMSFRESCYRCKYATKERVSDITICDFWGLGEMKTLKFIKKGGVSGVIINTDKGKKLFENCENNFVVELRSKEELMKMNGQLREPFNRPRYRNLFLSLCKKYGFVEASIQSMKKQKIFEHKSKKIHKYHMLRIYLFFDRLINSSDYDMNHYPDEIIQKIKNGQ